MAHENHCESPNLPPLGRIKKWGRNLSSKNYFKISLRLTWVQPHTQRGSNISRRSRFKWDPLSFLHHPPRGYEMLEQEEMMSSKTCSHRLATGGVRLEGDRGQIEWEEGKRTKRSQRGWHLQIFVWHQLIFSQSAPWNIVAAYGFTFQFEKDECSTHMLMAPNEIVSSIRAGWRGKNVASRRNRAFFEINWSVY